MNIDSLDSLLLIERAIVHSTKKKTTEVSFKKNFCRFDALRVFVTNIMVNLLNVL